MPRFQREVAPGSRWPDASAAPADGPLGPLAPRMAVERALAQRRQLLDQRPASLPRERRRDADVVQVALVVEQPEQQRPDVRAGPVLVPPEPGHDAVGGALVLDLEHRPLARQVGAVEPLGDDAVEARRPRSGRTSRRPAPRSRVAGVRWTGGVAPPRTASSRARRSPWGTSRRSSSPSASRSQATNDAGDSAASIRTRDSAGWIRSSSASNSSAPSRAITTSPSSTQRSGSWALSGLGELGEVAVEGLEVPALRVDLVAVAEDEGPEPVPLGLEQPAVAVGQGAAGLGEHGLDRGLEGESHARTIARRESRQAGASAPIGG